jgi:hypothetical protein
MVTPIAAYLAIRPYLDSPCISVVGVEVIQNAFTLGLPLTLRTLDKHG